MNDSEILIKDIMIAVLSADKASENLQTNIQNVLSSYSISKLKSTLPSTKNGETTAYLVKQFFKDKLEKGCSQNTLSQYLLSTQKLYTYLNKELNLASRDDIVDYLNYYRFSGRNGELKPNTVRNRYLQLSSFYTWLHKNKYIAENPFDAIDTPKGTIPHKQIITTSEREKILIALESTRKGLKFSRDIALVSFLGDTGIRVTECSNVKIGDVDFDNNRVIIRHGKGNKPRTAYFGDGTRERLFDYLTYRTFTDDDYLFTHYYRNHKLSKAGIENSVKTIAKVSSVSRLHPHLFRSTLATNMVLRGAPMPAVQSILGHANLRTMESYVNLSIQDVQLAFNSTIR